MRLPFTVITGLRAIIFSNFLPEVLILLHKKNMWTLLGAFLNTYLQPYSKLLYRTVCCYMVQ
jgi:hypothetical protein